MGSYVRECKMKLGGSSGKSRKFVKSFKINKSKRVFHKLIKGLSKPSSSGNHGHKQKGGDVEVRPPLSFKNNYRKSNYKTFAEIIYII